LHKTVAKQHEQNKDLKLQVCQLQALANIGITTTMIAHEINNLLTPVGNYAALAMMHSDDSALQKKALEKTVKNCTNATQIMKSMLALASGEAREKKLTPLRELIDGIFASLCRDFAKDSIQVELDIDDEICIWAVPVEIQQVFMNIILNARDAMLESGGRLSINAWQQESEIYVEIADTGCGMNPEVAADIFEPFFTTKKDGKIKGADGGSGLGLAFCKRVVDNYSGSISVESEPGKGSSFHISLPCSH
jgi:signal transduction histidine kinase